MTVAKALPKDLIDSLMSGYQKPADLIGEHGLLKQITKAVVERALQAEIAKPFEKAERLVWLQQRQKEIEAMLDLNKGDVAAVDEAEALDAA